MSIADSGRLWTLERTGLLATEAEAAFDRITRIAARLLRVPVSLVSLVAEDHQFFKSCHGLPEPWATDRRTPLSHSFCRHVMSTGSLLAVADARIDPLVGGNVAVPDLGVVAYLGSPLTMSDGHTIGALCAIDTNPRDWTEDDRCSLADLAAVVVSEIETRQADRAAMAADAAVSKAELDRQFQRQFQTLADAMPQMIWASKPDGDIDYYNRQWFDYTGLDLEQTYHDGWQLVVHPDDVNPTFDQWNKSVRSGLPHEMECRIRRHADRMYRWHLCRALPVRDQSGAIKQWVGTCTDIHEQKLAAAAVEQSRAELEHRVAERTAELSREHRFLEAVLDNVADGIVACDADGRLTVFNRATRIFHGLPERPLPPETWSSHYSLLRPDGVTPMSTDEIPLVRAFNGEVLVDAEMVIAPTTTDRPRRVVSSGRPFHDVDGNMIGAVVAMHDITDRVAAENEIKLAKEAAESATRAKTDFLANMSHEIRTPMTAILGYTGLLADPTLSDQERIAHVQVVRRNGEHLLKVLNDILDITKIESGKMTVELLECDPADVLSEVQILLETKAADKKLQFEIATAGDLPVSIITDPTRLKQILLNLVDNAIKFTNTGSVRITAGVVEDGSRKWMRFDVTDTGIGLTQNMLSRLFQKFGQADTTTNRRFGGTGLGLAICRELAEMLGGEVSVVSEIGKGSTFTVLVENKSSTVTSTEPIVHSTEALVGEKHTLSGARVLVAEDSSDIRRLVTTYLEAAGAAVEAVSNGLIAVDAVTAAAHVADNPFDLVLMDMQMPELDGFSATRRLRSAGFTSLPIVAFTANVMLEEIDLCIGAGCDDHVSKPIDRSNLVAVVDRNLRRNIDSSTPIYSSKSSDPLVSQMIGSYLDGLPEQVSEIEGAVARQDWSTLTLRVHQLRGSAGSYGFDEVTRLAGIAEATVTGGFSEDRIRSCIDKLVRTVRRLQGYDEAAGRAGPVR